MLMKELTKAEEEIMQHLWRLKKASVKDIVAEFPEPKPANNTVSTIVRILEQKGFVNHEPKGRGYVYFPIIQKEKYQGFSAKNLMRSYFEGSLSKMVSFFVEKENLSSRELDDILKIIEEKRQNDS